MELLFKRLLAANQLMLCEFVSSNQNAINFSLILVPVPASTQFRGHHCTLQICFLCVYRVWYKQATNKTLQLLSSVDYKYTPMVTDHRYLTESSATETNLTILQMTEEDVGTYYCGIFKSRDVVFGSGTVLEIEGESEPVQSVLQSPEYIRAQPGDSVTLSCSFTSSQHQQEHTRVMWVKTGSKSQIISWNYGKENIFCENTEEASCVHNLTLKDITTAEDGTYLCVVTACGDTLIGNATTVHVNGPFDLTPTVIALTVLNIVLGMAVVFLVWVLCNYHRKQAKVLLTLTNVGDEVTYAGVNVVPRSAPNRSTTASSRQDTVVYSEVRNQHV
uniref:Ig-like domain-containing protein n=1 Tax=Neogobius melanostomus TaxID=47308 RepID=A0A8C6SUS7_9GOBI